MGKREHQVPIGWVHRSGKQEKLLLPLSTIQAHCLVLGSTGWGKSGFLNSIILGLLAQNQGHGITLVDAKGETAAELLDHFLPAMAESHPHLMPEKIAVISPFSTYGVKLGMFSPIPGLTHEVQAFIITKLIGSLVDGFGTRMTSLLSSLVRCVLAAEGTILDVHRCLVDENHSRHLACRIQDPELVHYLLDVYSREPSSSKEAVRARVEWLLLLPGIRAMLASRESISGSDLLEAPLAVVDLGGAPQGQVAVARFVGALVFQLITAAVFDRPVHDHTPHRWLVADEWQELVKFAADDVERLLSLARFKRVGVWLCNQDLAQVAGVSTSLAKSLITNVSLQLCFRPNPADIKHLVPLLDITGRHRNPQAPDQLMSKADELKATLEALARLPVRHALMANRVSGQAAVIKTLTVPYREAHERAARLPPDFKDRFRKGRFGIPMDQLIQVSREQSAQQNQKASRKPLAPLRALPGVEAQQGSTEVVEQAPFAPEAPVSTAGQGEPVTPIEPVLTSPKPKRRSNRSTRTKLVLP